MSSLHHGAHIVMILEFEDKKSVLRWVLSLSHLLLPSLPEAYFPVLESTTSKSLIVLVYLVLLFLDRGMLSRLSCASRFIFLNSERDR